jgi:hypothetical protein
MTIRIYLKSLDDLGEYRCKHILNVVNLSDESARYYFKCSDRKEEFYYSKVDMIGRPEIVE